MQGYAVNEASGADGADRAAAWKRSRAQQDMAQHHLNQPYYGAAYNGFEQQNILSTQSPRQQNLASSHGYYGNSGRAPDPGGSSYYQAHSYSQSQQPQPQQSLSSQVPRTGQSDYPYATNQLSSSTTAPQYYQPPAYPAQTYGTDDYYGQSGQPSSASTFPSAMSGGNYQSISPPILPIVESHHPRPLLPGPPERLVRTESNEVQSTPELKGVFKKDAQETPGSGRKGKGKAVVAAVSEDGEEEENQEGNGKEGKVSTADFIRRLWTMVSCNVPLREIRVDRLKAFHYSSQMQAFSKEGDLGQGGKYLDWSATGDSFIIKDKHHFEKNILVQHFRHCNFSSFVRQLNKYGFKKVSVPEWYVKYEL